VAEVKIQEGESIESALRRFKRKVQQEDIIKDIKKHSFYLKPGDKRRAKQALARKRSRKKQRRETDGPGRRSGASHLVVVYGGPCGKRANLLDLWRFSRVQRPGWAFDQASAVPGSGNTIPRGRSGRPH
jgi:small subunit ribosomal protein S21